MDGILAQLGEHLPCKQLSLIHIYGAYNSQIEEILDACGIEYARTVESTGDFCLPEDFLAWHPTCHHEDERLMALAEKFCRERCV